MNRSWRLFTALSEDEGAGGSDDGVPHSFDGAQDGPVPLPEGEGTRTFASREKAVILPYTSPHAPLSSCGRGVGGEGSAGDEDVPAAPAKHLREGDPRTTLALDRLEVGRDGRVDRIETRDVRRLEALSSLGIVPGSVLRLLQSRVAVVVRVGETEVALDSAVARQIRVLL